MPSASVGPKLPRAMIPSVVLSREPLVESMVAAYRRRDTPKPKRRDSKVKMIDKNQQCQQTSVSVPATFEPELIASIPTRNGESECGQTIDMQIDEPVPKDPLAAPINESGEQHQITNAPVTPIWPSDPPRDPLQIGENIPGERQQAIVESAEPIRELPTSKSIPPPPRPKQVRDKHRNKVAKPRIDNTTRKALSADSATVLLNFLWGLHVAARKRLERTQREFEASSKALLAFAKENNFVLQDFSPVMPQRPSHPQPSSGVQLSSPFMSSPAQANTCISAQPEDLECFARGIVCPVFMSGSDSESTISDPSMMAAQAEMTHDNSGIDFAEQASRLFFDHYLASLDESSYINDPLSPAIGDETEMMDVANGFDPLSIQTANAGKPHNYLLTNGVSHGGSVVNVGSQIAANSSGWWTPPTTNTASRTLFANTLSSSQSSESPGHPCPQCGKSLKHASSMPRHLRNCGKTYPCDKCGQIFKAENMMKRHALICNQ